MNGQSDFDYIPFGERGWLVRMTGFADDVASGLHANAAADTIRAHEHITDAVAGIDTITIRFDDTQIDADRALRLLTNAVNNADGSNTANSTDTIIDIPVLYGGAAGPDLDALCARAKLPAADIIGKHSTATYRVITVGFAPGFAYMGPLDESLHAPRLATPRPRVAAGSVAVAGGFTGVYALPSPGGWNIIGRTPLSLFDAQNSSPFLFQPGASIRFHPIDETEFEHLSKQSK